MYSSKLFQTGRHWRVYISKFPFQSVLLLETQFLRQAAHKKRLQMLEQREKVGKLCKAVDIRERPSLRSAEHGPVQSCWHHTKTKQKIKNPSFYLFHKHTKVRLLHCMLLAFVDIKMHNLSSRCNFGPIWRAKDKWVPYTIHIAQVTKLNIVQRICFQHAQIYQHLHKKATMKCHRTSVSKLLFVW